MTEYLLVPRPIIRWILWAISVVLSWLSWRFLTYDLHAYLSGVGASFCLLCAGAIWSMREKSELLLEIENPSPSEFRSAVSIGESVRKKATWISARIAILTLAAASVALSEQFTSTIWEFLVYLGYFAVAESAYSFLVANYIEEQLIQKRNSHRLQELVGARNQKLINRIDRCEIASTQSDKDWTSTKGSLLSKQ